MRGMHEDGEKNLPGISSNDLLDAFRSSLNCLRQARVRYALIGAWALAVWGRPRATTDLDILVMVDEANLGRLAERMVRVGMEIDETWIEWNPLLKGSQLRLRFRDAAVDLLRARDAHDRDAVRRRHRKRLAGRYPCVVAADDFILQKLKVGRPRDFEDALSVLERSSAQLDSRYLWKWARKLRVTEELDYLVNL